MPADGLFVAIGVIAAIGIVRPTPKVVTILLVVYTMVISLTWPMLESLVAFKRAGANGVLSYFAPLAAERLQRSG